MNLNPAIVIPTFWSSLRSNARRDISYDYTTKIDKTGELPRCLESLSLLPNVPRIILLVVADPSITTQAYEKVCVIANHFKNLDTVVVGENELAHIHRRLEQSGFGALNPCASLQGYGSIRNLGILIASVFGHDTVIMMNENETVCDADFLERALHGIGSRTPDGSIVIGKTGHRVDGTGSYFYPDKKPWYRRNWNPEYALNEYMNGVMKGPRMMLAQAAYGGCMVLHADAFGRVAFDPWIPRGEDLDYVISARMYNVDIWSDNKLRVKSVVAPLEEDSEYFKNSMQRWFYENRKVEFAKTQIDLMQIDPKAFMPYPGAWLTKKVSRRALLTCLKSVVGDKEHFVYWGLATKDRKKAGEIARTNCARYFEFQQQWPQIVRSVWNSTTLVAQIISSRR